jgi:hypothetical protein
MKFNNAYIISWKPAAERVGLLKQVVAWTKSKKLKPIIIAMEWEGLEDTTNILVPFKMPPGQARNIGLNHFYSTEDDYCIILDDDTWIEQGDDIIDTMRKIDYPDVNVVTVLDQEEESRLEVDPNHIFRFPSMITSGVFIVKNQKKLFFNPEFRYKNGKLVYGEDVNFLMRSWYEGLGGWEVTTSMVNRSRDRSVTPSTWYYKPTSKSQQDVYRLLQQDFPVEKNGCGMQPDCAEMYINKKPKDFRIRK